MKNDPVSLVAPNIDQMHRHFAQEIAQIDRALLAHIDGLGQPDTHYGMLRYHFGYADVALHPLPEVAYLARGKRLRPLICLLFCRMFGLAPDIANTVMMATEVMHSASLAHDDIEDRDGVRWNRPTLQAAFGLEQAINAGDALIGLVYQLLLALPAQGVAPDLALAVIGAFNRAHLLMCEGQHLDLRCRYDGAPGIMGYLEMVDRKTGAACVCIGESIAILAAASASTRATLRTFGRSLGVLYQICDDVRGIWSRPDALGREIGHDLILHRPSLPLLYASQHGSAALRLALQGEPARAAPLSAEELFFIRTELAACGASRYCLDEAARYHEAALAALVALDMEGPEMNVLRGMLDACFSSVEFLG